MTTTTALPDTAGADREDGVTVVLPAYREEANLTDTVEDMLGTLSEAAEPHHVVIVNDGSPDATGDIADSLAVRYPGRVIAVHHPVNRGYGAAVRTGIEAALDQTDSRRLFLTDSDGQFRAAQLPDFIREADTERADAVIGYRKKRADPFQRKVNAKLWGWACALLLRVRARDVDCAYKLIDRRVLDGAPLRGEAGTISPELMLQVQSRGARVLQRPVQHFPRQHGEQTGAKLSVILASLIGLLRLWAEHARDGWPGHAARRLRHPTDPVLTTVTLAAVTASVAACAYFMHVHAVLDYPDATSRLLIARRVLEASTPGAAQLGGVWLPLPQLLALPTVWISSWYYSGLAGSVVSMISYVLATRYLYQTAQGLTGNRVAAVVTAVVFAANPNVLYLQSTPMSEMLLIACISGTVYHLMRWCQTGAYRQLAATGAAMLLGSVTRYEAWVVDVAVVAAVVWVAWRRRPRAGLPDRLTRAQADLVFYGTLAFSGILAWVLWNQVIFHDALYFQTGAFAKPSLWVSRQELAIGHPPVAGLTYLYAMADNMGWLALALAAVGLACYLVRSRHRADAVAPLTVLIVIPFYIYALYSGQRPLHVMQLNGSLYNVRFGVLAIIPVALFAGYLASIIQDQTRRRVRAAGYAALGAAAAASVALVCAGGVATLTEAQVFQASATQRADVRAGTWFRAHYDGGRVLMESFGNETVTFDSHIPLGSVIYEGSYRQWSPALHDPVGHGIRWIYMRRTPGDTDQVWRLLHGRPELAHYALVYSDPDRLIYAYRGAAHRAPAHLTGRGQS